MRSVGKKPASIIISSRTNTGGITGMNDLRTSLLEHVLHETELEEDGVTHHVGESAARHAHGSLGVDQD
ncbi:MAG: hypothetical protein R2710_21230 [Acidimicrobiales bacterium]